MGYGRRGGGGKCLTGTHSTHTQTNTQTQWWVILYRTCAAGASGAPRICTRIANHARMFPLDTTDGKCSFSRPRAARVSRACLHHVVAPYTSSPVFFSSSDKYIDCVCGFGNAGCTVALFPPAFAVRPGCVHHHPASSVMSCRA